MSDKQLVLAEERGHVFVVTINRIESRNAVDGATASNLLEAFKTFEARDDLKVAVLTGAGGTFCAGADLKAIGSPQANHIETTGTADGPMGPTRLQLDKPVIAAVSGHAVAGGLELACWCDLRVADATAVFGVFCRRWGVPLVDGGTVRLPRLIGHSRAMDMILTGRPVEAREAFEIGLANRLVTDTDALTAALRLADEIAGFPEMCMRADRRSAIAQWSLDVDEALIQEGAGGYDVATSEAVTGAARFSSGAGRHGSFDD